MRALACALVGGCLFACTPPPCAQPTPAFDVTVSPGDDIHGPAAGSSDPPLRGELVRTSGGLTWTSATTTDAVEVAVEGLPANIDVSGDAFVIGAVEASDAPEHADFYFDDGRRIVIDRGSAGIESPGVCTPREVEGSGRCETQYPGVFGFDAELSCVADEGDVLLRTGEATEVRFEGRLYWVSVSSVVAYETVPDRAVTADILVLPLIE